MPARYSISTDSISFGGRGGRTGSGIGDFLPAAASPSYSWPGKAPGEVFTPR